MATWELKNSVLTNKGTEVLNKVQTGIGSLRITRAVVGAGKVAGSELVNQTAVTDIKGEMQIVGKTGTVNGSVIDLRFDNTNLEESFDLWQIGIYVEHPDFEGEVLYHISQATAPDEVPLPSVTPALLSYSLYINHSNVPDITIEISPVGTVPMDLFQQHVNDTLLHTNFVDATGDGSTLSVTYDKIKTLEDGQHLSIRVPAALNEGATLTVNSDGPHNIVTTDGNNIKSGVVSSGFIIPVVYNAKTSTWNLEGVSSPTDISGISSDITEISNKIGNSSDNEEQLTLFGKIAAVLKRVIGVDDKVGTSDDTSTEPTLFGKIAGIGDTLSENLTPVIEKITEMVEKVLGLDSKIGETDDTVGSNKAGSVMGKLNTIYNLLMGGLVVFDEPGTYEWTVPAGITRIKVSGCGAGAGAGGACCSKYSKTYSSQTRGGGGGGGGAAIKDRQFEVTPGTKIAIKIGKHGIGGKGLVATEDGQKASDGTDGEATVIGSLITLAGGHKGIGGISSGDVFMDDGGNGGLKGGEGGNDGQLGFMLYFRDGLKIKRRTGDGGSTILENVGKGGSCLPTNISRDDILNYEKLAMDGGNGQDGYVSITWGV